MKSGIPTSQVIQELEQLHAKDEPHTGRPGIANTYDSGLYGVEEMAARAFGMYFHVNALYSSSFPSVYDMERELVRIGTELTHAPPGATGSWTSGGNESCVMAVKTARDCNRHVRNPKVVLPVSAHPAWTKGAQYMGLETVVTPIDPVTYKADVNAIRNAIDERTIMVVQSAPQYAHGVIDPIEEVAAICRERNVWLQVDGCIGGWVLPFAERLGRKIPLWDFRVEGVRSVTLDPQKYGYTPKGCSLVLYRTPELRRQQFFVHAAWTGYPLANSTMQSSKPGGVLAAAWSVIRHIGDDGYLRLVRESFEARDELMTGIGTIPELEVMGKSQSSIFAVTTRPGTDFYRFTDELKQRGWAIQPQLGQGNIPPSIHFTMAAQHREHIPSLLAAMRGAATAAQGREPLLPAAERERIRSLPSDSGLEVVAPLLLTTLENGSPTTHTFAVLDAMPNTLRATAMLMYFDSLTAQ